MANWAQNKSIAYKDYVPVNPTELMTQVGVQREGELQLGIQKVSSYLEQIAGLDVARDVDKQHIQQRIVDLKQGITKNLSGDFSDQRIINQIGGAASTIYKDPRVQNDVISTAVLRKGQSEMETARKEGKNGVWNDWLFNKKATDYITSTDPGNSFAYNYEKYTDVNKNIYNIIDKIKPSGTSIDEAFDSNGRLKDSVTRTGFKGVRPDQIKAALRAGLSPQDWRQMEIDGMGSYSNLAPEQFAQSVQKHYSAIADNYKAKLELLNNASTTSPEERTAIEQKKIDLQNQLDGLKEEYDGVTSTFAFGDADSAKAKLHTLNTINQVAAATSYGEIEKHYVGDTPQQMEKWRQDKAQDWEKFSLEYEQKDRIHADDMTEKRLTREQKDKELKPYGSLAQPLSKEDTPAITLEKFTAINEGRKAVIDSKKNQFITDNGYSPTSAEGKAWYAAKEQAFLTGSQKLNPVELSHFQGLNPLQKQYDNDLELATQLKTKYEASSEYKKVGDLIPADAKSVIYQEPSGQSYTFSPRDIVDFNSLRNKYVSYPTRSSNTSGGIASPTIDWKKAEKELSPKQYKLLQISEVEHSSAADAVRGYIKNYNRGVNEPLLAETTKMKNDLAVELQNKLLITQATDNPLPSATKEQMVKLNGLLSSFGNYATNYGKGKIGNTDAEDLAGLLKDDDKTVSLITLPGSDYQEGKNTIVITGSDKVKRTIDITDAQKRDLFGTDYDPSPEDRQFAPIETQLQKAGGYTTQLGKRPYLDKTNFPAVTNYNVQGNVVKDPNTKKYMLQLSITDPITGVTTMNVTVPTNGLIDKKGVNTIMNNLNDVAIFNLLNGNKTPTQQELDALQKAAQKPSY